MHLKSTEVVAVLPPLLKAILHASKLLKIREIELVKTNSLISL